MPNPKLNELFTNTNVKPKADAVVTEVTDKGVEANVIAKAESVQQADVRAVTEAVSAETPVDSNYIYSIERGTHKLMIKPEQGIGYNYLATCSCAWQGRFMDKQQAEARSKRHVFNFPRRG